MNAIDIAELRLVLRQAGCQRWTISVVSKKWPGQQPERGYGIYAYPKSGIRGQLIGIIEPDRSAGDWLIRHWHDGGRLDKPDRGPTPAAALLAALTRKQTEPGTKENTKTKT